MIELVYAYISGRRVVRPTQGRSYSRVRAALEITASCESMEVPMTQGDPHATDAEDAAFDTTMKIGGVVIGLVVIAGLALWYFYS